MLLCDAAQVAEGKLFVLGGGWSIKGADSPMAVALKVEVPWSAANEPHSLLLTLRTADGEAVHVETPAGRQPVQFAHSFEVGRPPGLPHGMPLDLPLAINFGTLPLPAGARFEWRLEIDGHTEADWYVSFMTRGGDAPPAG